MRLAASLAIPSSRECCECRKRSARSLCRRPTFRSRLRAPVRETNGKSVCSVTSKQLIWTYAQSAFRPDCLWMAFAATEKLQMRHNALQRHGWSYAVTPRSTATFLWRSHISDLPLIHLLGYIHRIKRPQFASLGWFTWRILRKCQSLWSTRYISPLSFYICHLNGQHAHRCGQKKNPNI